MIILTLIAYIDETSVLADKLSAYFTSQGIEIDFLGAHRGDTSCVQYALYSLVLMDISACDNWITEVVNIRRRSNVPIVLLTEFRKTADAVTAFQIGADDYVLKSTETIELAMRIQAMLRRCGHQMVENTASDIICFDDIMIDSSQRTVMKKANKIELTRTEFDILYMMVQHSGQILSREQLCEGVWSGECVADDKCIMSHIHRLRIKIEDDPSKPRYIITVRGIGYRFNIR